MLFGLCEMDLLDQEYVCHFLDLFCFLHRELFFGVWMITDIFSLQTLCNNCGLLYERDKILPVWSKDLHASARQRLPPGGGGR